jgi:hypothetical protein
LGSKLLQQFNSAAANRLLADDTLGGILTSHALIFAHAQGEDLKRDGFIGVSCVTLVKTANYILEGMPDADANSRYTIHPL